MDWQRIASYLEKLIPIVLVFGSVADWLRLRFARRAEERKHIARAISVLLEMRFVLLALSELPKHLPELIPKNSERTAKSDSPRTFGTASTSARYSQWMQDLQNDITKLCERSPDFVRYLPSNSVARRAISRGRGGGGASGFPVGRRPNGCAS